MDQDSDQISAEKRQPRRDVLARHRRRGGRPADAFLLLVRTIEASGDYVICKDL